MFGKLKGHKYYFIPNKDFEEGKEFIKSLDINYLKRMYAFLGLDIGVRKSAANKIILDKIIRTIQQYSNGKLSLEGVFPAMLEIAAEQLGIERKRVYTLKELSERILEEYNKIIESENYKENMPWINRLLLARTQLEFDKELLKNAFDKKYLISYDANIEEKDEKVKRMRRFIAMAFPKIAISNMLIALLLERENVRREKAVD
ncbi:hypothetical protein [Caloramator sp. Dgby_cultured_2]|uniref:hypothetical protein n=1 Tax=Caloramator sp. Dgby_cultured_2 TaxID=3029174 RepID=UPI00237DC279|nr:hypothetical protein [Caloramator sp. Dgby_cultured_2]WDU82362.1 hypothetical protein PWK10_11930 [Caloramator sp. Dgby_cultured_2]